MRRVEILHHSPEQVRLYIDEAEGILTACGYDDDERIALLPTIINLLSSKTVQLVDDAPLALPNGVGLGRPPG